MPIFSGLDFGTFAFNYEPLLYPDSIRLLQLVPPDSPGRPLIQDILIAKLSEAPRFVAVSYCWGTAEQTIPIQCGQRILLVTPNLASALLAIRPAAREAPELFWIDQLCINQRNLSERAHQVKIMGHIYQQAAKTVVWLGKEEPYFPLLQELHHNLPPLDSPVWKCLANVLQRPWFRRVWVIQEVV
ncbi:heterokaryon incompatibility protein-domain-containing protein, partial [Phaeosphaeriaceae sp. PMI808]